MRRISMQLWRSTINKSLVSNVIAVLVVVFGVTLPQPYGRIVLDTGLFALSGGITNWLAVHMLFERVPGLYGSGVVQIRFEEFKLGIRALIIEQFFIQMYRNLIAFMIVIYILYIFTSFITTVPC